MAESLGKNLAAMERGREAYWRRQPHIAPLKLRWRALTVRHSFQVLPGETILDLGAGSGLWTEHLSAVLRGENPITAAVFNDEFIAPPRDIPNAHFVKINNLMSDLPADGFDYVVGTGILCHDLYPQNLHAILRLLKPGGQILFFDASYGIRKSGSRPRYRCWDGGPATPPVKPHFANTGSCRSPPNRGLST